MVQPSYNYVYMGICFISNVINQIWLGSVVGGAALVLDFKMKEFLLGYDFAKLQFKFEV